MNKEWVFHHQESLNDVVQNFNIRIWKESLYYHVHVKTEKKNLKTQFDLIPLEMIANKYLQEIESKPFKKQLTKIDSGIEWLGHYKINNI